MSEAEGAPEAGEGAKAQEYYEQLLRLRAEFENAKKRWERERQESARLAGSEVVNDLLTVLDHFEEALKQVRAATPGGQGGNQPVLKGFEMISQELWAILKRHGLSKIETVGQPFDPHLHEAVSHVEHNAVPEHQIVEELRSGYRWHDRVLRHAMVSVAKPLSHDTSRTSPIQHNEEGLSHG